MEKNVLCVKNRDARQQYLAQMLLEDGCQVTLCEEKCRELGEYELVLLPVVTAKLDLKQMICQLQKGQRVFGGNLPEFFQDACMEKGVSCYDYMEEETIAVKMQLQRQKEQLPRQSVFRRRPCMVQKC